MEGGGAVEIPQKLGMNADAVKAKLRSEGHALRVDTLGGSRLISQYRSPYGYAD